MSDAKTTARNAARVKALCSQIMPLFNGVDPDIVGCVLGTLVGTYFSNHNPAIRDKARVGFNELVERMTEVMDAGRKKPWPQQEDQLMTKDKDWAVQFSDQAQSKMAEDPEAAAFVREHLARIKQVLAEFEAGRFASVEDAMRSIGMEPHDGDIDDLQ